MQSLVLIPAKTTDRKLPISNLERLIAICARSEPHRGLEDDEVSDLRSEWIFSDQGAAIAAQETAAYQSMQDTGNPKLAIIQRRCLLRKDDHTVKTAKLKCQCLSMYINNESA